MKVDRSDGTEVEFITLLEDKDKATVFQHFKGKKYRILAIGRDSENLADVVIYQGDYASKPIWVRTKDDFFSEVDHKKYPLVKAKYRFQRVNCDNRN